MSYLVDSDWIINALAQRRRADTILVDLASAGLSISIITLAEIYERAYGSPNPQDYLGALQSFISNFTMRSVDEPLIARFAEVRAQLRRQGRIIPDFDILLGVTAVHHDLTLLAFNVRHLDRIPGIRIYEHP
jgi:predicted nucleic acid-binding protein